MSALTITAEQINSWVSFALWPLFRVAALLSILPTIGGSEVPVRVRTGLAVLLTILIVPSLGPMPSVEPFSADSIIITAQQILIGVSMGLVVLLVFNAVTIAGESIAISMGLGFALMNDPQNGAQVPTVSQFYLVLAMLIFLSMDGHHAVLMLLDASFTLIPVGQSLGPDAIWVLLTWTSSIFAGALTIALPAMAAVLTVNMIMGVISRAAPQLNLFSVGFPISMMMGFMAIIFTLPSFRYSFERIIVDAQATIVSMLGG